MRREVCNFSLEWTPGSKLHYHPAAAHLVMGMVIEAVTGRDYREVIRERVMAPLGLANELFVGVPAAQHGRCADVGTAEGPSPNNRAAYREAGVPGGGGYGTARAMAAFYQMLLGKGRLGEARVLSPRMVEFVTRNFTGERPDEAMAGVPMHRGLGPHVRGLSERIRGLGTIGSPNYLWPWRRRDILLLGRPGQRRVVRLPHQFHPRRAVAFDPARPHRQFGPRRHRGVAEDQTAVRLAYQPSGRKRPR